MDFHSALLNAEAAPFEIGGVYSTVPVIKKGLKALL